MVGERRNTPRPKPVPARVRPAWHDVARILSSGSDAFCAPLVYAAIFKIARAHGHFSVENRLGRSGTVGQGGCGWKRVRCRQPALARHGASRALRRPCPGRARRTRHAGWRRPYRFPGDGCQGSLVDIIDIEVDETVAALVRSFFELHL